MPSSDLSNNEVHKAEGDGADRERQGTDPTLEKQASRKQQDAQAVSLTRPLTVSQYIAQLAKDADTLRLMHGSEQRWWLKHPANCVICQTFWFVELGR